VPLAAPVIVEGRQLAGCPGSRLRATGQANQVGGKRWAMWGRMLIAALLPDSRALAIGDEQRRTNRYAPAVVAACQPSIHSWARFVGRLASGIVRCAVCKFPAISTLCPSDTIQHKAGHASCLLLLAALCAAIFDVLSMARRPTSRRLFSRHRPR